MGSLWECLCFILRTLGAVDQQNSTYVVVGTLLFLLAPLCKSEILIPLFIFVFVRLFALVSSRTDNLM